MKKGLVVGVIVGVHCVVIGSLILIQGCGTSKPVSAPTETVMPPATTMDTNILITPAPAAVIPTEEQPKAEPKVYTVKAGDNLGYIAHRFKVTVKDIVALNKISNPSKIRPGQKLNLPDYVDLNAPAPVRKTVKKAAVKKEPAVAGSGEYVVKAGDMLSSIAVQHGTTVKALKEVNNLASDKLKIGQKLALPEGKAVGAAPAAGTEGEAAGLTPPVAEPENANVPPAGRTEAPAPVGKTAPITHMVEPGQDLNAVAMMYSVRVDELMKLNGLTNAEVRVGQSLKIPSAE